MDECIFCKIVKGEIPCAKIWEDEEYLAFLDIKPYVQGHVLVVPKKHSRWVWDMGNKEYFALMEKVKFISGILRKVFDTDWIEEVIAGMEVPHTHIHLLPRRLDDGLGEIPKKPLDPQPSEEEMKKIMEKIKNSLK